MVIVKVVSYPDMTPLPPPPPPPVSFDHVRYCTYTIKAQQYIKRNSKVVVYLMGL